MYALISSTENILDPNTQEVLGWRIAQIVEQPFEVYKTLFFVECSNEINANDWYYDNNNQQFKQIPQYAPPENQQIISAGTQEL